MDVINLEKSIDPLRLVSILFSLVSVGFGFTSLFADNFQNLIIQDADISILVNAKVTIGKEDM